MRLILRHAYRSGKTTKGFEEEKREKVTLGSSSMAEMRSERRSKQRRASGGCWAAEATMDSNCATSTPNRERGTFSLTYFFAISTTTKTKCYRQKQKLLFRRRRFKIQDWGERFGVKINKNDSSRVWEKWTEGITELISEPLPVGSKVWPGTFFLFFFCNRIVRGALFSLFFSFSFFQIIFW